MAIYSELSHYINMVIFHSYVSLPEGTHKIAIEVVLTCFKRDGGDQASDFWGQFSSLPWGS